MDLGGKIRQFVEEALEDPQYFLVDIVQRGDGRLFTILLDGDAGIPISECGRINRKISNRIDEEIPDDIGAFTIEVSSPGVDRPLKSLRQLTKHLGRTLSFIDAGGERQEGKLKELKENTLIIEQAFKEKGKKQQLLLNEYKWEQIQDPKVVVTFK